MSVKSSKPDVFFAISHRARRQMLGMAALSALAVNDIAAHFDMSRPAVSQHLRILLEAGLLTEERRGRERRYSTVPSGLLPVRDWLAQYEQFWDDRLLRLKKQLNQSNKK